MESNTSLALSGIPRNWHGCVDYVCCNKCDDCIQEFFFQQIGDNTEIMYFVARNEEEMTQWIAACRHGKGRHQQQACKCYV